MKLQRNIRFIVLAGAEDARLEGDDVVGKWAKHDKLRRIESKLPSSFLVRFLNWEDSPEAILRFARVHGHLLESPIPRKEPGDFRFSLEFWRNWRQSLRSNWESRMRAFKPPPSRPGVVTIEVSGSVLIESRPIAHAWSCDRSGLVYSCPTLYEFLLLDLLSIPRERLRKCPNPSCKTPYFVAENLRHQCCSSPCKHWVQHQAKLLWWAEHGRAWRKRRRKAIHEVKIRRKNHPKGDKQ
jgi:hypothetical protein